MGAWGTGIYSNDVASEVRDICREAFTYLDLKEAREYVEKEFKDYIDEPADDDDTASFWYALADWTWKKGVLSDAVKQKTLELLDNYVGLDEWKEDKKLFAKRKAVLDALKAQLLSPQPEVGVRKRPIPKPLHKPGDIIIAKMYDRENKCWEESYFLREFYLPYCFEAIEDPRKVKMPKNKHFLLADMYTAMLCVGSVREKFEEKSLYVIYDFYSPQKPTVEDLENCGFLPIISYTPSMGFLSPDYGSILEISWVYKFTPSYSFKNYRPYQDPDDCVERYERIFSPEELKRFNELYSNKERTQDYLDAVLSTYTSYINSAFNYKTLFEITGIPQDKLLDPNIDNPRLRPIEDINRIRKMIREKEE